MNIKEHIFEIVKKHHVHQCAPNGAYRTEDWVYEKILELVPDGGTSLETGAGMSTLFFTQAKGKKHIAIMPDSLEIADIKIAAQAAGFSLDKIDFLVNTSGLELPKVDEKLDFVLIDGCHGPLLPFVDFYFAAKNLNPGGYIIIDDIKLIAPRLLFEMACMNQAVEHVYSDNQAALLKIHDPQFVENDWHNSGLTYDTKGQSILNDEMLGKFTNVKPGL